MRYLAVCAIVRDEDLYLREWLTYHSLTGVEHFYIYDHESKNPVQDALGGFADKDRVTVRRVQGNRPQIPVYDDCLRNFGAQNFWIGFLDIDEFAFSVPDQDLRVSLAEFEPYAGVGVTWRLFHSSGYLGRPSGLVLKNYTWAFALQNSYHVKCFVRPDKTARALSPHSFQYREGEFCVNEDHYPIPPGCHFTPALGKTLRVNHYYTKSQQDFELKSARPRADLDTSNPADRHNLAEFYAGVKLPWAQDLSIHRHLPALEKAVEEEILPSPRQIPPATPPDSPIASIEAEVRDALALASHLRFEGERELAQLALCLAAPGLRDNAEFWALRALIAREAGRCKRAEVFVRQSLLRGNSRAAWEQLRALLDLDGYAEEAKNIRMMLASHFE
ncbi:MAG: glycosyltransferase family 92 protein [Desulfovibrio sp.]|jgi:hypothetical protein|nr:glycosyltransferase family 92 protein [Desulfovibrio sp.]